MLTLWLFLNTVWSPLGHALSPLSFVKLVALRFGHPLVRTSLPGGHAGVGVISLHGATLSLPTLFVPSFKKFFHIGRAMRVVLPLGNGVLFICSSMMAIKVLKMTLRSCNSPNIFFFAVLAEARMCCCAGKPVVFSGDFDADPTVILLWLRVSLMVT